MVTRGGRPGHGGGLERKVRAAGRAWTVGDIAMAADGQWAVRTPTGRSEATGDASQEAIVQERLADGRRVELTVEDLARAVGARLPDDHRDPAAE